MQKIEPTKLKKLLIMLPVFLIAVAGLLYVLFDLTSEKAGNPVSVDKAKNAFNKQLPAPNNPGTSKNKLEIYLQAQKDSLKRDAELQRDTNIRKLYDPLPSSAQRTRVPPRTVREATTRPVPPDPNEQKVNERLKKLYAAMNTAHRPAGSPDELPSSGPAKSPETDRLQRLLQMVRTPDTTADPTLDRVEKVLDKVLAIQHPVPAAAPLPGTSVAATVFSVATTPQFSPSESGRQQNRARTANSFYGLGDHGQKDTLSIPTSFDAIIPEDQTVQNGSTLKLRLLQDLFVGNTRIPANTIIYGTCNVSNERLQVLLNSLIWNDRIYPISLKVYDLDGLAGISVPGAITRDLTKEGMGQGIGSMSVGSLDPTLAGQAAAAGIETAKNLLSKKVKAVVVTIRAGHRVLLQPFHNYIDDYPFNR